MRRHTWMVFIAVGLFAWLGVGMGFAFAQIYPVGTTYPFAPITGSSVRISLLDTSGKDVTSSWLPAPNAQVTIQVKNGGTVITPTSISLVPPGGAPYNPILQKAFATSAYPGDSTNSGTDTGPDYTLSGNVLTSLDNGGMAAVVVNVNGTIYNFIIPQDSNFDGIPDVWETTTLGLSVGSLKRDDDIDTGPDPSSTKVGDGIANIDEYRGFKVGGQYIRGNPNKKDLFVHLEDTPQCITGPVGNFNGQGSLTTYNGLVYLKSFFPGGVDPTPGSSPSLYVNVDTLPNAQVHRINNDEWVSKFVSWDIYNYVTLSGTDSTTLQQDRWINKNSIAANAKVVKGVRIIDCLDLSAGSPLGQSDKNPPDSIIYKDNGNSVIYTHRIVQNMLNLIKNVPTTQPLTYYVFSNTSNSWVSKGAIGPNSGKLLNYQNPSVADPTVMSLMQIVLPWYLVHEALNHAFDVTATATTTKKASYGYHHADLSGTNVDIKITNKLSSNPNANIFYIPMYFGISDEDDLRILSSQ